MRKWTCHIFEGIHMEETCRAGDHPRRQIMKTLRVRDSGKKVSSSNLLYRLLLLSSIIFHSPPHVFLEFPHGWTRREKFNADLSHCLFPSVEVCGMEPCRGSYLVHSVLHALWFDIVSAASGFSFFFLMQQWNEIRLLVNNGNPETVCFPVWGTYSYNQSS